MEIRENKTLAKITAYTVFYRAVYTGIKNLSFSHILGFRWKLLGNYPETLQKTRIEKPTSEVWFFETPPVFHWFFANVNARSPLTGIILVFGHVGRDLLRNHPRHTVHYVRSKVERSRACAPLTKKPVWDSGFFAHALFLPKKREKLWVFLAV